MSAPAPSRLDQQQILQGAYDETEGRLRVDAEVTANISAAQEVVISHVDDSIKIGDGVRLAAVTDVDGENGLNVNVLNQIDGEFSPAGLRTALRSRAISITDVPTKIPLIPLVDRNTMSVRVWGAQVVFFGASDVTAAQGYPKFQYEEISMDVQDDASVELYAVCASGQSSEVRVLEIA